MSDIVTVVSAYQESSPITTLLPVEILSTSVLNTPTGKKPNPCASVVLFLNFQFISDVAGVVTTGDCVVREI